MNYSKIKLEHVLSALALLLALGIRLSGAEIRPLTDHEADLALQALSLSRGQEVMVGPHPAYLVLTTAMMAIFSAGNWVARFWPSVMGGLLVLLPMLFRSKIGKIPAILLAFLLALDPGLLAASRQAGSLPFALFFTLLAFGLWINQKTTLAGIAAGMAVLSGPQVWPGVLGLGAAVWVFQWLGSEEDAQPTVGEMEHAPEADTLEVNASEADVSQDIAPEMHQPVEQGDWRRWLIIVAATVFLAGTLFFMIPNGLSAMADSIPAYLRGWVPQPDAGISFGLLLVALLAYELFPLVFGLWGGFQTLLRRKPKSISLRRNNAVDRFLLVWFLMALLLALVYPGRNTQDLCWALLPLWTLAARQVARLILIPPHDRIPAIGHMVLAVVILGYLSMTLASAANGAIANPWEYRVRLAGAILMLVASTGLIAWGWSPTVAVRGLWWGIGSILLVYMISAGWNSVGFSHRAVAELWINEPAQTDADLLTKTVRDLEQRNGTIAGGPDMLVVGESSPALRWLLRDVERVQYAGQLPGDTSPALVVTAVQQELALASTYRGQSLVLSESLSWRQLKPGEWLRWAIFRAVPVEALQQNRIILWARADLFPGGAQSGGPTGNLEPSTPVLGTE